MSVEHAAELRAKWKADTIELFAAGPESYFVPGKLYKIREFYTTTTNTGAKIERAKEACLLDAVGAGAFESDKYLGGADDQPVFWPNHEVIEPTLHDLDAEIILMYMPQEINNPVRFVYCGCDSSIDYQTGAPSPVELGCGAPVATTRFLGPKGSLIWIGWHCENTLAFGREICDALERQD